MLIALIAAIQWFSGAYHSDFTAGEDEPAHAVSSLLVRDYLKDGFPHNPIPFAEQYYLHYPKVAIGHWPPLFYASEGVWMLLVGRTRAALLTFVALSAAALLISVFLWTSRSYGTLAGILSAFVLAAPAFVQIAIHSVSPNCLLALLVFWATAAYARYVTNPNVRNALLFAILTLAAIAVHGRAAVLLLVPVIAALLRRGTRWNLPRILLAIAVCAIVLLTPAFLHQADPLSPAAFVNHAALYLYRACASMSWPVAAIAALGCFFLIRAGRADAHGVVMLALVLSGWIFHSFVNAGWADYYLITIAPATAVLFGAGCRYCSEYFESPLTRRIVATALIVVACIPWLTHSKIILEKQDLGYHRLVAQMPAFMRTAQVYLVAGNPLHEGALVSEMDLRDGSLDRIVLRASKVLARSWWTGLHYQMRFQTPSAVSAYLDRARVEMVVMQAVTAPPHIALLAEALRNNPSVWQEVRVPGQPASSRVFRRIAPLPPGEPMIEIDLQDRIGRTLKLNDSPR